MSIERPGGAPRRIHLPAPARGAAGLLLLAVLGTAPAAAIAANYCTEPVRPFCMEQPLVQEDQVARRSCLGDVESFAKAMRDFAACLEKQSAAALEHAGEIETRLACMKRGEADCP